MKNKDPSCVFGLPLTSATRRSCPSPGGGCTGPRPWSGTGPSSCAQHRASPCSHRLKRATAELLSNTEREREMFYLTTHSTHFIYGYMVSDIWLRTILIVRKKTCCRHIGYSYRLTARVLLYAPSHRQDNTYHCLCYTSRGALAGKRNSSMGPPHEGLIRRPTATIMECHIHFKWLQIRKCLEAQNIRDTIQQL